jgi:hypothetical protein
MAAKRKNNIMRFEVFTVAKILLGYMPCSLVGGYQNSTEQKIETVYSSKTILKLDRRTKTVALYFA